jgi:predicted AlkP superfamily phosphohydrolase/phosphomutase
VFVGNGLANNLRYNLEFVCRETESGVIDILAERMSKYLRSFPTVHQTRNLMHVFEVLSQNGEKVTALSFPSVYPHGTTWPPMHGFS